MTCFFPGVLGVKVLNLDIHQSCLEHRSKVQQLLNRVAAFQEGAFERIILVGTRVSHEMCGMIPRYIHLYLCMIYVYFLLNT